jgi:hypothetical protein
MLEPSIISNNYVPRALMKENNRELLSYASDGKKKRKKKDSELSRELHCQVASAA